MTTVPRRVRPWRGLILLPLPYLALVGLAGGPMVISDPRGAMVLSVLAPAAGLVLASLMWARDRGVRIAGYVGYALVLTVAFGVGGVAALVNAVGGANGEKPEPFWLTALLAAGALASILSLVPLAAVIVADLSAPSQD